MVYVGCNMVAKGLRMNEWWKHAVLGLTFVGAVLSSGCGAGVGDKQQDHMMTQPMSGKASMRDMQQTEGEPHAQEKPREVPNQTVPTRDIVLPPSQNNP